MTTKKKVFVTLIIVVIGFALGGILTIMSKSSGYTIYDKNVGIFSLDDYNDIIKKFPSTFQLESVDNAGMAAQAAEKAWLEIYGDHIIDSRPYTVSMDTEKNVWLVSGQLHGKEVVGGVPFILIDRAHSRALAVWHSC